MIVTRALVWKFACQITLFLFVSVILMATGAFLLSVWFGRALDYIELVLLAKFWSLVGLIILGLELVKHANNLPTYLVRLNRLVAGSALLSLLIIAFVIMADHYHLPVCYSRGWQICALAPALSGLPLIGYALVNVFTALYEGIRQGGRREISAEATYFFCFVDVPCVIPILGIMAIVGLHPGNDGLSRDLFVSGAIAMFLLASNLLTIAVSVFLVGTYAESGQALPQFPVIDHS